MAPVPWLIEEDQSSCSWAREDVEAQAVEA